MVKLYFDASDPTWGFAFDGVTDDTAAWERFLAAMAASGGLGLLPPGISLTKPLSVSTSKQIRLQGAGTALTTLKFMTGLGDVGLAITYADTLAPPEVSQMALKTVSNGGIGLGITCGVPAGANDTATSFSGVPGPFVHDVVLGGAIFGGSYWLTGMQFNACWYPRIERVSLVGQGGGVPPFVPQAGLVHNNCEGLTVRGYQCYGYNVGIQQIGSTYGEGFDISNTEIVGCNYGVLTCGPGGSGTVIHDGHINVCSVGIYAVQHAGFSVHDMLLFKSGGGPYIGVLLDACDNAIVHDLNIQGPGTTLGNISGVVAINGTKNADIHDIKTDYCTAGSYGVVLGAGTSHNIVHDCANGLFGVPAFTYKNMGSSSNSAWNNR